MAYENDIATADYDPIPSGVKKTKLKLKDIITYANVAKHLSKEELDYYGKCAVTGYNTDKATRTDWESRNEKAIKLALQFVEKKSFPWVNCSNVKFPLVTVAALQFLARISILTRGRSIARAESWGADPTGEKQQKARRISTHMNFQLVQQDRNWLDDDEQAKLSASLLGCAVKKTYYDGVEGINRSSYVPLMDFVVDYFCKDLDTANRATQRLDMFHNKVEENVRRGLFCKMDPNCVPPLSPQESGSNQLQRAADETQGLWRQQENNLIPYEVLEQHCWLDLDDDGYCEPYVLLVRYDTGQVLRIVARFFDEGDVYRVNDGKIRQLESEAKITDDPTEKSMYEREAQRLEDSPGNKVVRIVPTTSFTKYTFIPSPDGGFYGLGFGCLLGPTNAAVDTLMNQMIDAGTMMLTAGGFLGRGAKIKSGKQSFDPFEWKPVDGAGDDLRKNIVPLPVNAPSDVLMQLLGLLIQYGEKIGSATDVMTGINPGQNTPAETSRNTLEQGMMLFSGIYLRMYRAFAEELRKMFNLNRLYLKQSPHFLELTEGSSALIAEDDYDNNSFMIYPVADPTAASPTQRQMKAKAVFELSQLDPSGFDIYEVKLRLLQALEVEGIEQVFPDPKGPNAVKPAPNPKVELALKKLQQEQQFHEDEMGLEIARVKNEITLNDATIAEMQAKSIKMLAEAEGVETGHSIAMLNAQLGAAKLHKDNLLRVLENWQGARDTQEKHRLEKEKIDKPTTKAKG